MDPEVAQLVAEQALEPCGRSGPGTNLDDPRRESFWGALDRRASLGRLAVDVVKDLAWQRSFKRQANEEKDS